jgi:hypothetical protein
VFAAADPREAVNVVHRAEGRSVRESGGGRQPAVRSCGELATQACSVAVRSSNTWRSSLNASTVAAQDLMTALVTAGRDGQMAMEARMVHVAGQDLVAAPAGQERREKEGWG